MTAAVFTSILLNFIIAGWTAGALAVHRRKASFRIMLRFFTVLSNLFCAAASLTVAVGWLSGSVPQAVWILKYVGTAAVTVTLLTVLVFLGPTIGYKKLLTGPDFGLHLLCPVLAILSFALLEKPELAFGTVFLGLLPVLLYGFLYLYKVIAAKTWEDFYGFNRGGKWPVSFAVMLAGTFLISWILWLVSQA